MTSICLNMIVRNEARIIERCLRSVAPHVDGYVILDTGSTDDTIGIVENTMAAAGVPGVVVRGEFHNFEQARNEALDAATGTEFDYLLLCDADMELRVVDPQWRDHLKAPAYTLTQRSTALAYRNRRLVRRDIGARYVGVTHEYLDLSGHTCDHLDGAWFADHAEGSSRAVKFERDIALLATAHAEDPINTRTVFYLAQSYRDGGDHRKAIDAYRLRVSMGGWAEEVWFSLLQIAVLLERLDQDDDTATGAYLHAWQYRPTRVEPLVALARRHRLAKRWYLAHLWAERAIRIPLPGDSLFVDESAYTWRALDEYAIAAWWAGDHRASANACTELLGGTHLPPEQRARVLDNLGHCKL